MRTELHFDGPVADGERRLVALQQIGRDRLAKSADADPQWPVAPGGLPDPQYQAAGLRVVRRLEARGNGPSGVDFDPGSGDIRRPAVSDLPTQGRSC